MVRMVRSLADRTFQLWYSLQLPADRPDGGFTGYPWPEGGISDYDQGHLANTYTALMILIICGDDLAKVDRDRVRIMLRGTQLADGRFCCVSAQSSDGVAESDIRFVYCAAVIAAVLDVWDCIDVNKMQAFLQASQSYDGVKG